MTAQLELGPNLYPYQARPAVEIVKSVERKSGHTFTLMFSRQAGKNETSAFIEGTLLRLHRWAPHTGIKAAPTLKPQAQISRDRLVSKLTAAGYPLRLADHYVYLARARWGFFTSSPEANVVGATAHLLLECDEAQDTDPESWNKKFMPMGATTNASVVYYGTPWTEDDLLAQAIAANHPDRNFSVPWHIVAEHNPNYARFVARERDRLGADHPLFLTQYELQVLPGAGRLLSRAQVANICSGQHPRRQLPEDGMTYVAGLDVAGQDTDRNPLRGRDSTVLTIGQVELDAARVTATCRVQEIYEATGTEHAQLFELLAGILRTWRVQLVSVDETALGEAFGHLLRRALGKEKVDGVRFTQRSKSDLGFALQAAATAGHLLLFRNDQSREYSKTVHQLTRARVEYLPNRTAKWSVPDNEGHDDHLVSLALLNRAAQSVRPARAPKMRRPKMG